PDRLAEGPRPLGPVAVGLPVLRVRHDAPVVELGAVDDPDRAVLHTELLLGVVGDHRDGAAALRAYDLEREAAEPAGGAPHQHHVARLHGVRLTAHQHAGGGGGTEQEAAGRLPGELLRLGDALVPLGAGELAVAAVVGLVAPDPRRLGEHRV